MISGSCATSGMLYDRTSSRLVESMDRRRILRRAESRESRTSVSMRCHSSLEVAWLFLAARRRDRALHITRANLPAFQHGKGTPTVPIVQVSERTGAPYIIKSV